jgi:DNA-binding transcriptional MocR family regulator
MPQLPENRPPEPSGGPPGPLSSSWEALYGRLILRDGIATIPLALYLYGDQLALSSQQVWFASAILAHKWDADLPYPRLSTVAEQTGVSIRTLQYIRKSLETAGYLQIHEGWGMNGGRIANSYDFSGLFAALEAAIAADPEGDNGLQDPDVPPDPPADRPDRSFLARYGRVISQKGIAAVPQALFTHQAALGLSPQQTWFAAYILGRRWTTGLPHPSLRRMAQRTGYSERQIHNLKEELVALGYLRLVHRHGAGGGQDTNGYDFSGLLAAITAQLQATTPVPAPLRHEVAALSLPVATAAVRPPRRGRHTSQSSVVSRQSSVTEDRAELGPVQGDSVGLVQGEFAPVQIDSVGLVQDSAMGTAQAHSVGPVQLASV